LCPGLTSYVSEQLGLRENVFALDLVGQGCGAALPNLRAAEAFSPPVARKKFCPSASRFAARHFSRRRSGRFDQRLPVRRRRGRGGFVE
jgi:hypothetical protein